MAAKVGSKPSARRPNVLGVHSLDHFGLAVTSLDEAKKFYGSFGLDVRDQPHGLGLHTFGNEQRWARLTGASRKALQYLSFGAFADDLERFRKRLTELGVERIDPPSGIESNGLWFRDVDGLAVEIKAAEKTSPDKASAFDHSPPPFSERRAAPMRSEVARVHPIRLAHVLMFVRDVGRSIAFYRDVLGLRLSDEVPGFVAFLHGVHGSDHHMLAFAKSDAPGLHHCSWFVGSVHDIGQGASYMAEQGYRHGWGLGRHVLGSNYFHYVRDPWGSFAEYSGGFDYIPADMEWEGEVAAPENGFYLWGPMPPEDFAFNYEARPEALAR